MTTTPAPGAPAPRTRAALTILHVDLDAFFASVEQLHDPALRGRPVIVGGTGARGVVAAASYEARRYGVHSAMPMVRARRLCPNGVFVPPRFDAYSAASDAVMAILRSYTPLVEPLASDEAFLDVGGARRIFGDAESIARQIRVRVRAETGLVASVGVASTKFLAKLASDLSKPDGLLVVDPQHELEMLHPLPVSRLWGVGPATLARLQRIGIETVGDLARVSAETLVNVLGRSHGQHLHELAHNRDSRRVEPDRETKSIGSEETFAEDLHDPSEIERHLRRLAERSSVRVRRADRRGRTVSIKVRFASFRTVTRSITLRDPTASTAAVTAAALDLMRELTREPMEEPMRKPGRSEAGTDVDVRTRGVGGSEGIRLLGVTLSNLVEDGNHHEFQTTLFTTSDPGDPSTIGPRSDERLDEVIDAVRARFGDDALDHLVHLDPGERGNVAEVPFVAPGQPHRGRPTPPGPAGQPGEIVGGRADRGKVSS